MLIEWIRLRGARRRIADNRAVMKAIRRLRPEAAHGYPIIRLSHLTPGRAYAALDRLTTVGMVIREKGGDPAGRAVYRLAQDDRK